MKKDRRVVTISKWLLLITLIGLGTGSLSALFLTALTYMTNQREAHHWLLFGLPLVGMVMTWFYHRYGGIAGQGNNLVIDRANSGSAKIPLMMLPLTLVGTITSHLFGASVGREGTAVQMGGSFSEGLAKLFKLKDTEVQLAIVCGMSGGFSSVFGTPFAGAIFAIEVLVIGQLRWRALLPSLATGLIANQMTLLLGVTHSQYPHIAIPSFSLSLLVKVMLASLLFGCTSSLFSWAIPKIKNSYQQLISQPIYRSGFGGLVIIIMVILFNGNRYLGLSLPLLTDAFNGEQLPLDFLNKLLFTVFSLGAGFQGGEVTPLFEIGATLGASLGNFLQVSIPFLAALGFIGLFAGSTNTPLACLIMGIELFGSQMGFWLAVVVILSYFFASNKGIYSQQMNHAQKISFQNLINYIRHKK